MKRLHFDYLMKIEYSFLVEHCNFTIKCIPVSNVRQSVSGVHLELVPNTFFNWGKDGLGNTQIYGLNEEPHYTFTFQITGDAVTGLADYEELEDESQSMIFRHPHGLNVAGPGLKAYYRELLKRMEAEGIEISALTAYEMANIIMGYLHEDFRYEPLTTNVNTTAEEAWMQGCGVCQDYAHIFISLLHQAKIAARYVTGLLIGEGASHAWVEILDGKKWKGLDPTNLVPVCDDHIKIGIGRHAKDCMINRGIMHGGGLHTQTIQVVVEEMQEQ